MAKACSKCKETKPFSSFHKHKGKPYGLTLWCKKCVKANSKRWYENQDPEERLSIKRAWQDKNREKVNKYNNAWARANPSTRNAREGKRRAKKLNATPDWLSGEQNAQIKRTYKLSSLMSEITGVEYHVDHIIPLQGENICGLHVPWNLQALRADLNLSKSNKFEGET